MVFAGLPIAVNPQSTEQSAYGTDDKCKVGETEIKTVDFSADLIKLVKAGLGGGVQGKKNDSKEYCQKTDWSHNGFNKEWLCCTRPHRSVRAIRVPLVLCLPWIAGGRTR